MNNNSSLTWNEIENRLSANGIDSEKIKRIKSGASFLTNFPVGPISFTVSTNGQAIGFRLHFEDKISCWRISVLDAFGDGIVYDSTLLPGINVIGGLNLIYRYPGENGEVLETELAIKGIYMTEPLARGFYRGIEKSDKAFRPDENGICPCSVMIFTDSVSCELYEDGIDNTERDTEVNLEEMDYIYKVL